jgi:hypothetical protein
MVARRLLSVCRPLQRLDVELLHLQHRHHGALGAALVLVLQRSSAAARQVSAPPRHPSRLRNEGGAISAPIHA